MATPKLDEHQLDWGLGGRVHRLSWPSMLHHRVISEASHPENPAATPHYSKPPRVIQPHPTGSQEHNREIFADDTHCPVLTFCIMLSTLKECRESS
ncbi:hypothetical protein NQZ68_026686 [Dissostichus eleginoides]|nr:hypothetical protein NQZ68_026686 [Dissostichus eleginoides]